MKLIVAFCKNRGIGLNNKMPWYLKSDLKRFKKLTMGQGNNAIVMGRNTWVSLKCLSLPKRSNIILTSKMDYFQTNNQLFMQSFDNVAAVSQSHLYDDIWLIGGEQIYRESLKKNLVDEIYATVIDNDFECDTFFPEIPKDFKIIDESKGHNENNIKFNYVHYKKYKI
jgi:dihydrofolate reductase